MYNPYGTLGTNNLSAMQQNPNYQMAQNPYAPSYRTQYQPQFQQMPQQQMPQQMPQQAPVQVPPVQQESGYDFIGKRVSSFEEVKAAPIPLDGKPMIFIDDENDKLYFKYLTPNGDQTLQSFNILTEEMKSPKNEVTESVSIEDFNKLKEEFETLKKELN